MNPRVLFFLTSLLSALSLALLAGCDRPAPAPQPPKPQPQNAAAPAESKSTHLVAKFRQPDGRFATIGAFDFRATGDVELTVTASGPEAGRLRAAWAEISARPSLNTKLRDADGNLVGKAIERGAPDYPTAVADVMSREFGFFLSPSKD